ncbi:MAG: alpha/beta fold hydrolase, partial [Thermoleophilia bacterium]|nr:alpha/beta fold hydrolase [Thermoleophilia bacterium]
MDAQHPGPEPQPLTIDSFGVPLAAVLYLPHTHPRGALLVCHGAGSRKENHVIMAEQAVAAGLAALLFDFRGHGASGGAMDDHGSDDVIAAGDALRRLSGAPWVAARGASMGAMLLVLAARRRPDLLRSLVLLCPADGPSLLRGLDRAAGPDRRSGPPPAAGPGPATPAGPSPADDRSTGRFDEAALRPFLARLDLIEEARGLRRV